MRINELTPYQIADLRLKCVQFFIETASRHGLEKGDVFVYAETLWSFILKGLESVSEKHAEKPSLEKKSQSLK